MSRFKILTAILFATFLFGKIQGQLTETEEDASAAQSEEQSISFGFLLVLGLELFSFLAAYVIKRTHFQYLQEAGATMILATLAGAAIRILATVDVLDSIVRFNSEFFFLVLLPPIIFESGYNMSRKTFFSNMVSIILFAFVGTTLATFVTAGICYLFSGLLHPLTGIECLLFGALISATDPVTVLAIFKELKVDPNLYSNVFGESVLNDAVAIVLYRTLLLFVHADPTAGTIFGGIGQFVLIFGGSLVIGSVVAFISALLFKYTSIHNHPEIETPMIILFAYAAYLLAEGSKLSGIVSILFCGIVMAHYTRQNLSKESKERTTSFFEVLATIADTLVFIFLGLALFSFPDNEAYNVPFIIISIIACLISRAMHVWPLAYLSNLSYPPERKIPLRYQFFMWFAGLRGGIAFALSIATPTEHSGTIFTTTLVLVFLSVLFLGGATVPILLKLKIPNKAFPDPDVPMPEEQVYDPQNANIIERWDDKYLKPVFTRFRPHLLTPPSSPENNVELQDI